MAHTFNTADGLLPEDLLQAACDHASAAQALAETSPSHLDSAGYLAHIALELLLKSWLLSAAGEFSGTHKLETLYETLRRDQGAPQLSERFAYLLATFDSYAELRYPNRDAPTEVGSEDIGCLGELIAHLYALLPVALYDAVLTLKPTRKGGRVLMKKKIDAGPEATGT